MPYKLFTYLLGHVQDKTIIHLLLASERMLMISASWDTSRLYSWVLPSGDLWPKWYTSGAVSEYPFSTSAGRSTTTAPASDINHVIDDDTCHHVTWCNVASSQLNEFSPAHEFTEIYPTLWLTSRTINSDLRNVEMLLKKNVIFIDLKSEYNKIHVQTNTQSVQCLPVKYHKK